MGTEVKATSLIASCLSRQDFCKRLNLLEFDADTAGNEIQISAVKLVTIFDIQE
jgi:hypothetical protein